ncbi:GGDEF domain-containing protein [Marinomonas sp. TW1]|uniref:GGDEF domain-containing protein n=1 Tax=Marinomonas sp. TW1 TaxID=1561203 RepID=UPI0007AF57BF|nr:GGDEF domain-containing protein [Marinomonas sp. TW1]
MHWPFKITLNKQFSLLLLVVIVLFIAVGYVLQKKLEETQSILHELSNNTLPSMANASETAILSTELFLAIEQLTQANNPAARRIAQQEVQIKINESADQAYKARNNPTEALQLKSLQEEVSQLTQFIDRKLNLAEQIANTLDHLIHFQSNANQHLLPSHYKSEALILWQLNVSKSIGLAYQSAHLERLNELSLLEKKANTLLETLDTYAKQSPPKLQLFLQQYNDQLRLTLVSEQGLISLQKSYLKIAGRTRGREHFIRKLVEDYTNVNDQLAFNETANVKQEVLDLTKDIEKQKNWLITALLIFATMIGAILMHYRRVISRLKRLTNKLEDMATPKIGHNAQADEIDELFEAFEHFSTTIKDQTHRLETLSLTDSLTKIANRRAFDQKLKIDLATNQTTQDSLSILLIDIDYFKQYNDTYGHLKGDVALQKVASVIQETLGNHGLVARYGGEEFVAILPSHDIEAAKERAQQTIQAIAAANIEHKKSQVADHLSISLGLVTQSQGQTDNSDTLMKQADQALYQSKAQGRNQATHYNELN